MEILVSCFGTLLMLLQHWSLCFQLQSEIFQLHLSLEVNCLLHKWTGSYAVLGEWRRCPICHCSVLDLAVSPGPQPISLFSFSAGKMGAGPELRATPATRGRRAKTVIKACIIFSTRAMLIPLVLFENVEAAGDTLVGVQDVPVPG